MLNWLRKLLHVPVSKFYGRDGKEQPLEEGMAELFRERDHAVMERNRYYFEVLSLRKALSQSKGDK